VRSRELLDRFWHWLWCTWLALVAVALAMLGYHALLPDAPLRLTLALLAVLALAPVTALAVAVRWLAAASRARREEATDQPGPRGFVERHGVAIGLVVVALVVALIALLGGRPGGR
jgi:uncharacterized membrane protein